MLLEATNMRVRYRAGGDAVRAVDGVDLALAADQVYGIVGESGCGKSTLVKALLRLLPRSATIDVDRLVFNGRDLMKTDDRTFRREVLWRELALVPQSAQNSLNPVYRVGDQIVEAIRAHAPTPRARALERVAALFDVVGLQPDLLRRYPHEFSGGMRQRAMIAMALAFEPALVVMDEPTTGLDVLVQERLLRRIREIRQRVKSSILLITHDIAVIAEMADRIGVMYAGRMVEDAPAGELFERPFHPYTLGLRNAFPNIREPDRALISIPGAPPDLAASVRGCGFAARCPFVREVCRAERPDVLPVGDTHLSACLRHADIAVLRAAAAEKSTWRS
ncbi:MAG: ABC transporter ATP-binding protein [Dongiaceae bacterium]